MFIACIQPAQQQQPRYSSAISIHPEHQQLSASANLLLYRPGGHGTCFDFPNNETLVKGLGAAWDAGKVVGAVCHGPVAFANVKTSAGEPIVKGKKVGLPCCGVGRNTSLSLIKLSHLERGLMLR